MYTAEIARDAGDVIQGHSIKVIVVMSIDAVYMAYISTQ